jgi:hypothetical protein
MQWLGVAYSVWHNRRHDRSGHLFQGRFKSFVVEEDDYLERLLLYVHRNPVRAGLVERLSQYRWSSYPCLAYGRECVGWLARDAVLGLFGGERARFRRAAQAYSEEAAGLLEDLRHGVFLGSETGLARLLARARPRRHREKPASRAVSRGGSVDAVVRRYAAALGVPEEELGALRRPVHGCERPLRDVLMHAAWEGGGFRLSEIGEYFGVGYTTVAMARARAVAHLKQCRSMRRKLEALDN